MSRLILCYIVEFDDPSLAIVQQCNLGVYNCLYRYIQGCSMIIGTNFREEVGDIKGII
ncbi:hypothetical protein TNCV_3200071, partial [Trichonephila clavipes]